MNFQRNWVIFTILIFNQVKFKLFLFKTEWTWIIILPVSTTIFGLWCILMPLSSRSIVAVQCAKVKTDYSRDYCPLMCYPLFWNAETIELVSIIKILEKAFIEYIFSTTWCNWLRIVHINKKMKYVTLMMSYIMSHFTQKPIFLEYYLKKAILNTGLKVIILKKNHESHI